MNMADREPDVNDFCYTDEILDDLEVFLSRERLGTYLDAAREDREEAAVSTLCKRCHPPSRLRVSSRPKLSR